MTDDTLGTPPIRSPRDGGYTAYTSGRSKAKPLYEPNDPTQPWDELDPRHGSYPAYSNGCRCTWCKIAGQTYRRYRKLGIPFPSLYNSRDEDGLPVDD